ncbi:MAG TPA: mechanosensitive ion channel domain-containing protein [Burkholderiaceae bacterium]|nr:mechanosensitive ion channel domain-containing protein [Burkholderiaceae bacterium]
MQQLLERIASLGPWVTQFGLNLILALVILVVGWVVSDLAGRAVHKAAAHSSRIDPTVVPMAHSATVWTIRIFVIVAVLARFGVQTASIIAVLGAAGLALGLALQGTLQNIAAGIMLLALRPIRAGEFVSIVGKADGTIDEVGLFLSRLTQADGTHISLPNSLVWGNPIVNYSRNKTRRLDFQIGVRYGDNLELALSELRGLVQAHELVLKDPEPQVMVTEYRDNVIIVNIRAWSEAGRYWDLRFDLYRRAPEVLGRVGLQLPIPVREIQTVPSAGVAAK